MKPVRFLRAAVLLSLSTIGVEAAAQTPGQTNRTTTQTADYTEQTVGGDQVVKFTGDELAGLPKGAYGTTILRLPGATRVGLIRPRVNFVTELVKSVENL